VLRSFINLLSFFTSNVAFPPVMLPVNAELKATLKVSFSPRTNAVLFTVRYDCEKAGKQQNKRKIKSTLGIGGF
jgi:hypothetical protein